MKDEIYHVISNTHWDREWYQCHEKYLVRLVELMDRLVNLLEKNNEYRFVLDGQYAILADYLEARPEMRDRVSTLVKGGQLLSGPWYTQPLENIVGGEALVRNLQYGIAASEKLGGAMRFSYEVDEFGHTTQLPQILNNFDIHGVIAWRGVPNHSQSIFTWLSPDGSAVDMLHTNGGYGEATDLPKETEDYREIIDGKTYERQGLKNRVKAMRELRLAVSPSRHRLWLNGIDHSWAQEDLFEVMNKIKTLFPEIDVIQSTPEEYRKAVLEDLSEKGVIPRQVEGELMYTRESVLESTNAIHPRQKLRHYESEDLLTRKVEPFTLVASLLGRKYPAWGVERAWRYVLENHAHDSLGCCSVDEVFEQVMARYGAALSLGEQLTEDSLRCIMACGKREPSLWVFNPTAHPVEGVIEGQVDIPEGFGTGDFAFFTPEGKELSAEILERSLVGDVRYNPRRGHPTWGKVTRLHILLELPRIEATGWLQLKLENRKPSTKIRNARHSYLSSMLGTMENEYLRVSFRENGTFDLLDKTTGRTYPSQLLWEDSSDAGSCYVHVESANDPKVVTSLGAKAEISCLYDTALGSAWEVRMDLPLPKGVSHDRKYRLEDMATEEIKARVTLLKGAHQVGIRLHITNRADNHRLRVLFPSLLSKAEQSLSGQAFDIVRRPIEPLHEDDLPSEQPYVTKPMQDFCAITDGAQGLAVAVRGIYEYECIDDESRSLALTVVKCSDWIDTDTFAITPEYEMKEAQNHCTISYTMALIPYDGSDMTLMKEASTGIFAPVIRANRDPEDSVLPGYCAPQQTLPSTGSALQLEGEGILLSGVKHAEERNSAIVRLVNYAERETQGSIVLSLPGMTGEAWVVTAEEKRRAAAVQKDSKVLLSMRPKEILTLEFPIKDR